MARGDGIHRTNARNMRLTAARIGNAQQHNEREKESYVNQDIVPERTHLNVHFKKPTAGYAEMFEQLKKDGIISTRGLKEDAFLYGELVFDVNTAYFHNHGGYDFAKQFYTDAYKSAIEIVGGEQYILSAVMHADERNRAMSDALEQDVYHYHLHVVYISVFDKGIITRHLKNGANLHLTAAIGENSKRRFLRDMAGVHWGPPCFGYQGSPQQTPAIPPAKYKYRIATSRQNVPKQSLSPRIFT